VAVNTVDYKLGTNSLCGIFATNRPRNRTLNGFIRLETPVTPRNNKSFLGCTRELVQLQAQVTILALAPPEPPDALSAKL
jgi:hypothetical protein